MHQFQFSPSITSVAQQCAHKFQPLNNSPGRPAQLKIQLRTTYRRFAQPNCAVPHIPSYPPLLSLVIHLPAVLLLQAAGYRGI